MSGFAFNIPKEDRILLPFGLDKFFFIFILVRKIINSLIFCFHSPYSTFEKPCVT